MGRIERLGRILPGDGPVVPVTPVRLKRRDERQDDEEADREEARREHARHALEGDGHDAGPSADGVVHVDVRA
jgi:hypothetical protein